MGTTTSPDGLYKPAISETGWGALVNASFDTIQTRLNQLPQTTEFVWDHTGGSTATWNIRARGATDAKSLIRMMPQGVGEDASTGDRSELTWMFEDIDLANRGWVDLKVKGKTSDNVRFFHILTDKEGTAGAATRFVMEMDPDNVVTNNEFAITRDNWYDTVEAGTGSWMFRIQEGTGITRIENGTIALTTGNLVLGSSAGDIVIHTTSTMRPWADGSDSLGADAFRWSTLYMDTFVDFQETTDPTAPGTNEARLYAKDNGSGKTQIVAKFNTGAVQVIATEP